MDIYAVKSNYRIDSKDCNTLISYLSSDERDRINRYRRWEDAQRGLIGRVLIRSLINKRYGLKSKDINFLENEFGKPYFKNAKDFHFNISHSGQWVVCIIDCSPVGIDIEEISDIDLYISTCFFSGKEHRDLLELEKKYRLDYFFDLWSLKESYIKAEGKGLSIQLDSFSIKKKGNIINIIGIEKKYHFKQYHVDPNYKLSVCAMNKNFPKDVNIMDINEFTHYSINSFKSD